MKKIFFAVIGAALTVPATTFAAKPSLKVFNDNAARDTVHTAKYYAIGITDPGVVATINGQECEVYATGTFGAAIELREGLNTIKMTAGTGRDKVEATDRVVYIPSAKRPSAEDPKTIALESPFNVKTLDGAYLQHGNGSDRLGGSKMNFLSEGIELTVIGKTDNLYQVALGHNDHAYIQQALVSPCKDYKPLETVNTNGITIQNSGDTDRISISLPRRLPYYTRSEVDPSTILLTLYGATNNTNWLRQISKTDMLEYVDLRRDSSDALTIVMRLRDKYQWGYAVNYEGNSLIIDIKHRPASLAIADLTIGLDAGHGGKARGAVSITGLEEKTLNLDIILKMADILRGMGAKVVLTRDDDTELSMSQRKQIWLDGKIDLAISVHNNASGNPLSSPGTSSFYKHVNNRSLALSLHKSMLGLGLNDFGLTGNFNFSLNAPTEYPNALVEVLFMSSLREEAILSDPDFRTKVAQTIVNGLLNYLEEVKNSL